MFKTNIQEIGEAMGLKGEFLIDWGTDDIIKAYKAIHDELHPPPVMEEITVKRWAVMVGTEFKCTVRHEMSLDILKQEWPGCQFVEISIPVSVPSKPKTRYREELVIESYTVKNVMVRRHRGLINESAHFFIEW